MNGNLWIDDAGKQYFLVPDECAARDGSLAVRDLDGDTRTLDPEQAAAWRVDEDRARELTQAAIGQHLGKVQDVLGEVVQALGGKRLDLDAPDGGSEALGAALDGLFGLLRGELGADPAARQASKAKLDAVVDAVAAGSGEPEQAEKLKDLADSARKALRGG